MVKTSGREKRGGRTSSTSTADEDGRRVAGAFTLPRSKQSKSQWPTRQRLPSTSLEPRVLSWEPPYRVTESYANPPQGIVDLDQGGGVVSPIRSRMSVRSSSMASRFEAAPPSWASMASASSRTSAA
jgi:hypothetical protein